MFDTAFEQVRHYATNDAVVSLRLLCAIGEIAGTLGHDDIRAELLGRARRVVSVCGDRLDAADATRLQERLAALEHRQSELRFQRTGALDAVAASCTGMVRGQFD